MLIAPRLCFLDYLKESKFFGEMSESSSASGYVQEEPEISDNTRKQRSYLILPKAHQKDRKPIWKGPHRLKEDILSTRI